jgi:hypothetical protein
MKGSRMKIEKTVIPDLLKQDWITGNIYGLRESGRNKKPPNPKNNNNNNKREEEDEADVAPEEDVPWNRASTSVYVGMCNVNDMMFGRNPNVDTYKDLAKLTKDTSGLPVEPNASNNFGEWVVNPPANAVFSDLPFKSNLFRYTVESIELKRTVLSNTLKVHKCVDYDLEAVPFTPAILLDMIMRLNMHSITRAEVEQILKAGPWALDIKFWEGQGRINQRFVLEGGLKTLEDAIESSLPKHIADVMIEKIREKEEYRVYLFNEQYRLIKRYYDGSKAMKMPCDTYEPLCDMLKTCPHQLCFHKVTRFMWKPNAKDTERLQIVTKASRKGMVKLPELTLEDLEHLMTEFKDTVCTTQEDLLRVKIYSILKDNYEEKHIYINPTTLVYSCSKYIPKREGVTKSAIVNEAINWLVANKIAIHFDDKLYLREAFKNEMTIAQSLQKVIVNRIDSELPEDWGEDPLANNEANTNTPPKKKKQSKKKKGDAGQAEYTEDMVVEDETREEYDSLCSEQRRALHHHKANPLMLVIGKGGSGKTKLLSYIASLYNPGEVMGTAFQNANVGVLKKAMKGCAFTSHMLVYTHDRLCHKSPYFNPLSDKSSDDFTMRGFPLVRDPEDGEAISRIGIPYKECIYERIKVLIVDEISTMYPEILAKLLGGLVTCGQLKSVIFAGDTGQILSMYPGNAARDIKTAFEELHCSLEFHHNHRSGVEILTKTAQAIRDGNPDGIEFDDDTCIHIDFEERGDARWNKQSNAIKLEFVIEQILDAYNIPIYEHHIITRTNEIRKRINRCVEDYFLKQKGITPRTYGNGRKRWCQYNGMKYLFRNTDNNRNIVNGQVMILSSIEDFEDLREVDQDANNLNRNKKSNDFKLLATEWRPMLNGALVHELNDTLERPLLKKCARKLTFSTISNNVETTIVRELEVDAWVNTWIDYGNCTTNHAFQGAQSPTIIYVIPYGSEFETRESAYTAFTRPTHRIFFVGKLDSLKRAINNPEPARRTTLTERIVHYCSQYKTVYPAYGSGSKLPDPPEVIQKLREETEDYVPEPMTDTTLSITTNNNNNNSLIPFSGYLPVDIWILILENLCEYPAWIRFIVCWMRVNKLWRYKIAVHNKIWATLYQKLIPTSYSNAEIDNALRSPSLVPSDDYFFRALVGFRDIALMDYWLCHGCNAAFTSFDIFRTLYYTFDREASKKAKKALNLSVHYTCGTKIKKGKCGVKCTFTAMLELDNNGAILRVKKVKSDWQPWVALSKLAIHNKVKP